MGPPHRGQRRSERPPLTGAELEQLAMHYVARYATTAAKLTAYLTRKCRERASDTTSMLEVEQIVAKVVALGYVDDAAYAVAKANSLGRRGYGARRIHVGLRHAGIAPDAAREAIVASDVEPAAALDAYMRRRRMGPYAAVPLTREVRQRAIAALIRAGHAYDDIVVALSRPVMEQ